MVTLRDFVELDHTIIGLELTIRKKCVFQENHCFGLGCSAPRQSELIEENHWRAGGRAQGFDYYLHPVAINLSQDQCAKRKYWGVKKSVIPKKFLDLEIIHLVPYSAAFDKGERGTYYSIDLELESESEVKQPKKEKNAPAEMQDDDQMTFDDLLGGE